ncbi:sensor histidine kinase [Streptomyces sp. AJS327]|nr:sensor histidine kinase [Streptomyces sp. AJS327]
MHDTWTGGEQRTSPGRLPGTSPHGPASGAPGGSPAGEPALPAGPRRSAVATVLLAPVSGRTWREYLYVLTSFPFAILSFVYALVTLMLGVGLLITFIGIPVLAVSLLGCRVIGWMERGRARALLDLDVAEPEPVRALQRGEGLTARVSAVLRSGSAWRNLLYTQLHFPWALFTFVMWLTTLLVGWAAALYPAWHWVHPAYMDQPGMEMWPGPDGNTWYLDSTPEIWLTSGIGLLVVLLTPWLTHGLTSVDRLLVAGLLGPSRLATRMWELESDRGTVVDTAAADLRRIERDLHDGAQARLVALAMDLGLAKEKLLEDPEAAAEMVGEAHGEVKLAIEELRDLARGIHPAILTDRGLGPALSALASRCTATVSVTVELDERPAQAIEGMAYFTVSELLQNVSKHARAERAWVDVWRSSDRLFLQVSDDGRGGASAGGPASGPGGSGGSGLTGLAERLDAVDGLLVVDSPEGGPTRITAELPWR